jgi:hypothetical protein
MNFVAIKMLVGDRSKYLGLLIGHRAVCDSLKIPDRRQRRTGRYARVARAGRV